MRFLRFRLRTLMVLVAVVAILLGRSVHFSNLAHHHARERRGLIGSSDLEVYLVMQPASRGWPGHPESGHPIVKVEVPIRAFVAHHLELEAKYDSASRYPWFPVAPDPPEPPKPSKAHMELYRTLLHKL